jgi:hypothetical protein
MSARRMVGTVLEDTTREHHLIIQETVESERRQEEVVFFEELLQQTSDSQVLELSVSVATEEYINRLIRLGNLCFPQ